MVKKYEVIDEFKNANQRVESEKVITDLNGNEFILYELKPAGYAIYSEKDGARVFLEDSYETNSAFYEFEGSSIYYLV